MSETEHQIMAAIWTPIEGDPRVERKGLFRVSCLRCEHASANGVAGCAGRRSASGIDRYCG